MRIYIAGSAGAEISDAVIRTLRGERGVEVVGIALGRMDPAELRNAKPDLLISAAHAYLIRRPELDIPRLGSVGLHPSVLPRYRGSYPLWWALRNGESQVGLTLYRLTEGMDDGPILRQASVAVRRNDTFRSLYARVAAEVPTLLKWLIDSIEGAGGLPPGTPQDERLATVVRTPGPAVRAIHRARWELRARLPRRAEGNQ